MTKRVKDCPTAGDRWIDMVVEDCELPEEMREHLAACSCCREERDRLQKQLDRLGHMARELSPPVRAGVIWTAPVYREPRGYPLSFRGAFAAGLLLVVVAAFSLWPFLSGRREEGRAMAALKYEMAEDALLMAEVHSLEENALPPAYSMITGDAGQDDAEDDPDFDVSDSAEEDPVSM